MAVDEPALSVALFLDALQVRSPLLPLFFLFLARVSLNRH
jgi:hypothetical protein